MPLTIGACLGPYEIIAMIGAGGMGEVYKARDTRLDRTVAIKVLTRDKVADPERKRRFLQEARTVSALNHPNIVTLYDIASDGGIDYLVMEYVPGKSLDRLITPKALPLSEALNYAQQIGNALAAAHAAGIVHRDIKPANVMVTPESQVKVLDFGLAKPDEPPVTPDGITRTLETALTRPGIVLGTVAYMSPEQARAEKVDARSDLFSFGAVLYEMATGRRAFPKSLDWTRPPASRADPELDRIVFKLIDLDSDLRYQTAADVVVDLKRLRASRDAGISRRRWLWTGVSAGLVAAAVWGAIQWRSNTQGTQRLSDGNRSSSNAEANGYYERAMLFGGGGVENNSQRVRMLQRALALDPRFAAARAEFAFSSVVMILNGDSNDPDLFYRTEEQVRQALQDDPGCGRAHSVLALTYLLQGQKELVPPEVAKALQANPDDMTAPTWLLEYYRLNGDYARAAALAKQIISRWPLYWPGHLYLGILLQEQCDAAGAIREQERVLEQDAQNVAALAELSRAYIDARDLTNARQTLERARPGDRRNYGLRLKWALLLGAEGKRAEAFREMDGQVQAYASISNKAAQVSEFYALVGEPARALEWLDKAVRASDDRDEWWGRDPLLMSLRDDSRFRQILVSVAHRRKQRPRGVAERR
jgi:tRNA A-37 threonylcarbamoyl transferase component Bud32/tetratricopeptide (TPR) repeat protein